MLPNLLIYNFLILDMLLWLPWLLIYTIRPDLRRVLHVMGVLSMPFAFTEFLFYPDYWQPRFLWNLADAIGFGLEDVLFVIPLGGVSGTIYAVMFGRRYYYTPSVRGKPILLKLGCIALLCGGFVWLVVFMDIPMIFGAIVMMAGFFGVLSGLRPDLFWPGMLGGCLCAGLYVGVLGVYQGIYPDIFATVWNTINFMNVFVLGIPIEEVLYGFACGLIATVLYPFLMQAYFKHKHGHL